MGVYKRGRCWYIDYRIDGRRVRESVGPNRKVAERALAKRKVQIAENRFLDVVSKPKTRFEQLVQPYMDYAKVNKRSWSRDDLSIRTLARWFAGKRLSEITPLAIENYKSERRREVGPATVNRELACLKHMFNKAIQWGMAASNPVRMVKMLREDNARLRYLTKEEVRQLHSECPEQLGPIVLVGLHTGMRTGEILRMRWDDVDFDQQIIFVRDSKNGQVREIPIASPLMGVLKGLQRQSKYVFCEDDGSPISRVRRAFAGAVRRAGISDFTFHDLRHTFASHLVMAGVDLLTVKELLGHQTINMTLRYAHLSPSHRRKAVESLEYFDGHKLDTKDGKSLAQCP